MQGAKFFDVVLAPRMMWKIDSAVAITLLHSVAFELLNFEIKPNQSSEVNLGEGVKGFRRGNPTSEENRAATPI